MEKPKIEKLRELATGFEHDTFRSSEYYAEECENLEDLLHSIDDNMTITARGWDTRQIWDFDDDNDLIIGTITGYNKEDNIPIVDAFLRISIPDSWK